MLMSEQNLAHVSPPGIRGTQITYFSGHIYIYTSIAKHLLHENDVGLPNAEKKKGARDIF